MDSREMNPDFGIVNSSSGDNSPKRISKEKRTGFSGFKEDESESWNRELVFRRQLP